MVPAVPARVREIELPPFDPLGYLCTGCGCARDHTGRRRLSLAPRRGLLTGHGLAAAPGSPRGTSGPPARAVDPASPYPRSFHADLLARRQALIVTIPGSAFGRSGEGHLRLSYGSASADAVRDAMHRLRRYCESD